jgi:PAS domain-containing protein
MSEQKRIGKQLDQLVAERTRELAEANEALKKELVVERQRTEAVQRGGRLIVASIPGLVAGLTPTGGVDFVNDPLVEYCGRTLEELQQWGPAIRFILTTSLASSGSSPKRSQRARHMNSRRASDASTACIVGFRFVGFPFGTPAGPFSVGTPYTPT